MRSAVRARRAGWHRGRAGSAAARGPAWRPRGAIDLWTRSPPANSKPSNTPPPEPHRNDEPAATAATPANTSSPPPATSTTTPSPTPTSTPAPAPPPRRQTTPQPQHPPNPHHPRLMLASGGVARDYLRLAGESIKQAQHRGPSTKPATNRVTVEDANAAAGQIAPSKFDDLQKDSPNEADALTERVIDLTEFCRNRRSAYFLVDSQDRVLNEQMKALQHFRFAHLLAQSETIPDAKSQRFNVYLLDAAQLSAQRATQGVDFEGWKQREKRRNRKLVYSSSWESLSKPATPPWPATGTLLSGQTDKTTTPRDADGQGQLFA